ncbi:hypothetical protein [Micromonospora sp. WMMD998]|uniref:hypothetical protein n=1 Tax=Micromonospora sp. WMMD998 TaxID=3016092 RepID=UPI00249A0DDC|nr:hypothetical protein [Micromonospora sp. WMMD998]WFE38472.1 hypothetical protein O7619_08550 [Micromonospora sp. WMMD998]
MSAPNASPVPDRGRRVVRPHLPMRPRWLCRVCAGPWPCQPARLLLLMDYRRDRVALSIYMAACLFDATADLLHQNPEPQDLFDRFLGWAARPPLR